MYVESICTYDEKVVEFEGICAKRTILIALVMKKIFLCS